MTEFEELYSEYFSDVYLYIKSLTNDDSLSQDIVSETFIRK